MAFSAARARELSPPAWTIILRNAIPLAAWVALAWIAHFYVQPQIGAFPTKLLMDIGINVILAVSLTLVNGFTGQFSIGHAGFMAIGGYYSAAITYYGAYRIWGDGDFHGGLLSWTSHQGDFTGPLLAGGDGLFLGSCLAGGLIAAIAGYLVGLPSLRLRGDYLAIVTLGFGEIVRVLLQSSKAKLATAEEIAATPLYVLPTHLGKSLGFTGLQFYTTVFWVVLLCGLTLLICYRLKQSTHGRAFLSIREDEIAAEAMGVHTTRFKVRAFVIAAFLAGVAGALYAHEIGSINAGELGFQKSFDIVIMVVLGGMGSISGATVAAVILTILPELLRDPPSIWPTGVYIFAGLAVLILLARRGQGRGAIGLLAVVAICWEVVRVAARAAEINLADYRMIIYALLLITMMIVKPQGLFGVHEIWNYFTPGGVQTRRPAVRAA